MTENPAASVQWTRRGFFGLAIGAAAAAASPGLAAPSYNSGAGAFRRLRLYSNRLGEKADLVYWIDGVYVPEAMQELSHVLRDWRTDQSRPYDRRVLDVLSAAHRKMDCQEPYEIVSGYRSPQTNAMLRVRNRGVARNSYHVKAMAVDVALESRSVRQMANAAESLHAGGVGRYTRSEFVHMDCGPVRTWGR
ncbi:MAG: DUF882 domain-containing protein [Pseudomonadota bacterium]